MPPNQRRTKRVRRRVKVFFGGKTAFTSDISLGGFCAELMQVPPPGTAIDGSITIGSETFPFSGEIVWAKSGAAQMGIRGRIGIRFKSLTDGLRLALESVSESAGK